MHDSSPRTAHTIRNYTDVLRWEFIHARPPCGSIALVSLVLAVVPPLSARGAVGADAEHWRQFVNNWQHQWKPTDDSWRANVSNHSRVEVLSADQLKNCKFELVMMDDRPIASLAAFGKDMQFVPPETPIPTMSAVVNYAYALRFGYSFRYVQLNLSRSRMHPKHFRPAYYPSWYKVFYFVELLRQLEDEQRCTWFVYLDSDAQVHQPDAPLPAFISDLAARYRIANTVGTIFAMEQAIPGLWPTAALQGDGPPGIPGSINGGVFLANSNAQSRYFFDMWRTAAHDSMYSVMQTQHPADQGVLTALVVRMFMESAERNFHTPSREIAIVNMTEINSPWGRFIAHAWGGEFDDRGRQGWLWDGLVRIGATEPARFLELLEQVHLHVKPWAYYQPRRPHASSAQHTATRAAASGTT